MNNLIEHLPEIISAAAQSYLGMLALLSVALSVLAVMFFVKASEPVRAGVFGLLFLGVAGFGVVVLRIPAGPVPPVLSKEAKQLLQEAARDPSGLVMFERYGASVDLHTNGRSLLTTKDHRGVVLWEAALRQLVDNGLFAARGEGSEVFEITEKGYEEVAEYAD